MQKGVNIMKFEDSKTYKNLQEAFAGECMARTKYNYFSSKAKKEGYEQIAAIFEETADNEKEHAKLWFKALHNNDIPSTVENLIIAAEGEYGEWSDMYKRMAEEAKSEGYHDLASKFAGVAKIEEKHEERYRKLLQNIQEKKTFTNDNEIVWKCRNCGHLHVGKNAPTICPVCVHPQSFFEIRCTNY